MIASIWTIIKYTLSQKVIVYCYIHRLDIVCMHVHVCDTSSFEEECITIRAERFRACIIMNCVCVCVWEGRRGGEGTTDIILTNDYQYQPHYD